MSLDLAAHMAYPHDAYALCREVGALFLGVPQQRGGDVLGHRGGVAPGSVEPFDAVAAAVVGVDVVVADGSGADKPAAAPVEQDGVAAGAGADYQHVGISHGRAVDGRRGQVTHLDIRFENAFDEWYLVVDDDNRFFFHEYGICL